MTNMTEHFLPDYHHWGDMTTRIEELITVPIKRVPKALNWVKAEPPFVVMTCSWFHLNIHGPLTQEKFDKDLEGAILDFTNEINAIGEFAAYPITHKPPTVQGIAYHDWIGGIYPFDIRVVIALDEQIQVNEEVIEAGLKFHISTLLSKGESDGAGK